MSGPPSLGATGLPEDLMLSAYGDPTRDIGRVLGERSRASFLGRPGRVGPSSLYGTAMRSLEDLESGRGDRGTSK